MIWLVSIVTLWRILTQLLISIIKKNVSFHCGKEQTKSFQLFKDKFTHAPILNLPNFDKIFKVECDVSAIGIGAVLLEKGRPFAYFSEKLNGISFNFSTYDKNCWHWFELFKCDSIIYDQRGLSYTLITSHSNTLSLKLSWASDMQDRLHL